MLKLLELQNTFSNDLLNYTNNLASHIDGTDNLNAEDRIEIYRSSMTASMQKSLTSTFTVCHKLVGEEFFIYLANEYIQKHPSLSPDLNDYGSEFPLFLAKHPKNTLLYLADMAHLEWAYYKAFNAPDTAELDCLKLNTIDEAYADQIIFLLPPDHTLLSSPYPLLQIWKMNQADLNQEILHLPQEKIFYFFIWHNKLDIHIEELQINEWKLLNLINKKVTLGEMSNMFPEQEFLTLLADFTKNKWLCDFKIGCENDF